MVAHRVLKNSFALMSGRGYRALVNLGTIAMIARYLDVEKFGEYAFILAIANIFMVITDMGALRIGIRDMARNLEEAAKIFTSALVLRLLLGVITFFCIVLIVNILSSSQETIFASYICAAAVILFFWGDVFSMVFKAFEKMKYDMISSFYEQTAYLLFVFLFIRLDWGLDGIFISLLISYFVGIIYGFWITQKVFFKFSYKVNWDYCKFLLKEGFPIGSSRILRKISYRIDTIILKLLKGSKEAGIFHAAYRVIFIFMFIPQDITDAVFPLFCRLSEQSQQRLAIAYAYEKSFKFLLIGVIPLISALILYSKELIVLVFGEQFVESWKVFDIMSLVLGLMFFSTLFIRLLSASDRQWIAAKCVLICLIINVILDFGLIPFFGYMGAAVATLIAELTLAGLAFFYVSKHISKLPVRKIIFKPVLAGSLMMVFFIVMRNGFLVLTLPAGLMIYASSIVFFRVLDKEEMEMLKTPFKWKRNRGAVVSP